MGLFREDSPIEIFEKSLLEAVKIGNTSTVKTLLASNMDIPAAIFNKALEKAVKEDKIKTVEALLSGREVLWKIEPYTLRTVIYGGNKPMFLALYKGGFDFEDPAAFYCSSTTEGDKLTRMQVVLWKKEIAYDAITEELQALKHEITSKGGVLPEIKKVEPGPQKKDSTDFTM
jgi:hypothetical protein